MKAFIFSVIALVAVTAASAFFLQAMPVSSSDAFSEKPAVRL